MPFSKALNLEIFGKLITFIFSIFRQKICTLVKYSEHVVVVYTLCFSSASDVPNAVIIE